MTLLACLFGVQTSPLAGPDGMDATGVRELARMLVDGITT